MAQRLRGAGAVLFGLSLSLCAFASGASADQAPEATTTSEPQFFVAHGIVETDAWWLGGGGETMEYVIKGLATQTLSDTEGNYLSIQDFTVKVAITPANPAFRGWVFVDRIVDDRVFPATYDAAAGVYRVRADAEFHFPTTYGHEWWAGWTSIYLSFPPGGPISVSFETDGYDDWWFL